MKKPNNKDFVIYGSGRQYIKALEEYVKYFESEHKELTETHEYTKQQNIDVHNEVKKLIEENNILKSCINLNNPMDGKIKTEFKIFANRLNGNVVYSIFDDKLIMREISSIEKFVTTLKMLLNNTNS